LRFTALDKIVELEWGKKTEREEIKLEIKKVKMEREENSSHHMSMTERGRCDETVLLPLHCKVEGKRVDKVRDRKSNSDLNPGV
jgi:hypothetical protein